MFDSHESEAVAMQEIEVISMDDGEDNVRPTSLTSPPSGRSSQANSGATATPPCRRGHSGGQSPSEVAEAMEQTLFAMAANERPIPPRSGSGRRHHRSRAFRGRATPISITGMESMKTVGVLTDEDLVNDHDRTKMCDWYYEMSDFLKIDRTTASRSLTLLDRFMAAPVHRHAAPPSLPSLSSSGGDDYTVAGVVAAASRNRDEYQLVALTALFLAIKLFERLNIQPEHVSYLSRGRYTSDEVVRMEMVVLAALEWRVCGADKVDFVRAFLNVSFPNRIHITCGVRGDGDGHGSSASPPASCNNRDHNDDDGSDDHSAGLLKGGSKANPDADAAEDCDDDYADPLLKRLKDLANLQIQLSDFESSFSTLRHSMVAFAAVINAFEMKKDKMMIPAIDQVLFLEIVQRLIGRMYPTRGERERLARTVDRLRVLVDPPTQEATSRQDGKSSPAAQSWSAVTPEGSRQEYQHPSYNAIAVAASSAAARIVVDENSSTSTQQVAVDVSPLDVALDSMESFGVAQLLCCGAGGSSCHADAGDLRSDRASVVPGPIESVTSFGSADGRSNKKHRRHEEAPPVTNHSPTSIATILFGAGAK